MSSKSKEVLATLNLATVLPPVNGDRTLLQQVVVNLDNTVQALAKRSARRSISIRTPQPDPSGMEMGLAVCRSIIEAHGGRILADNESALGGARFSFSSPAYNVVGH